MADSDIGGRDELAALIEGKSDDEINGAVAERGTEKVLGQLFGAWAARFDPARAGNQSAVVGFDITSPEGTHQYQLKVADGTCQAVSGAPEAARAPAREGRIRPRAAAKRTSGARWWSTAAR
jgi:hypothetical protein